MIIDTLEELQQYVPATASFDEMVLMPQIKRTEKYLLKFIDKSIYDALITQKNNNDLEENFLELFEYLGAFVANYSVLKLAPKLYSSISDAGVRVESTENTDRSPKWAYEELKKSYFEDAYSALEDALMCIDLNSRTSAGDFYTLVSYEFKANYRTYFIRNSEEFSALMPIKINQYTYRKLKPLFKDTMRLYIDSMVAPEISTAILESYNDGTITEVSKVVHNYISRIVANASLLQSLSFLVVQISGDGIRSLDLADDETILGVSATPTQIQSLKIQLDSTINHYQASLKKYLMANSSEIDGFEDTDFYKANLDKPTRRNNYLNDTAKTFMI